MQYYRCECGFRSTPPHGGRPAVNSVSIKPILFRSTPPHGGRPGCRGASEIRQTVSIHAPARRATMRAARTGQVHIAFRSTPPHGGRLLCAVGRAARRPSFDPRPRTEGDLPVVATRRQHGLRFDPRPRTEGDLDKSRTRDATRVVSIHAPARRATARYYRLAPKVKIRLLARISKPVVEAVATLWSWRERFQRFQGAGWGANLPEFSGTLPVRARIRRSAGRPDPPPAWRRRARRAASSSRPDDNSAGCPPKRRSPPPAAP